MDGFFDSFSEAVRLMEQERQRESSHYFRNPKYPTLKELFALWERLVSTQTAKRAMQEVMQRATQFPGLQLNRTYFSNPLIPTLEEFSAQLKRQFESKRQKELLGWLNAELEKLRQGQQNQSPPRRPKPTNTTSSGNTPGRTASKPPTPTTAAGQHPSAHNIYDEGEEAGLTDEFLQEDELSEEQQRQQDLAALRDQFQEAHHMFVESAREAYEVMGGQDGNVGLKAIYEKWTSLWSTIRAQREMQEAMQRATQLQQPQPSGLFFENPQDPKEEEFAELLEYRDLQIEVAGQINRANERLVTSLEEALEKIGQKLKDSNHPTLEEFFEVWRQQESTQTAYTAMQEAMQQATMFPYQQNYLFLKFKNPLMPSWEDFVALCEHVVADISDEPLSNWLKAELAALRQGQANPLNQGGPQQPAGHGFGTGIGLSGQPSTLNQDEEHQMADHYFGPDNSPHGQPPNPPNPPNSGNGPQGQPPKPPKRPKPSGPPIKKARKWRTIDKQSGQTYGRWQKGSDVRTLGNFGLSALPRRPRRVSKSPAKPNHLKIVERRDSRVPQENWRQFPSGHWILCDAENKPIRPVHPSPPLPEGVKTWLQYYAEMPRQRRRKFDEETTAPDNTLCHLVSLWKGDITTLKVDAIVNAAKGTLLGGSGVDGAIHKAAGPGLKAECEAILPGGHDIRCKTGDAKLTGGHKLPARYVIHTVGPHDKNPAKLKKCYENCLQIVKESHIRTVVFPCIATGDYGFPHEEAAEIALAITRHWLETGDNAGRVDRIVFCTYKDTDFFIYEKYMQKYFPVNEY